VAEWQMQQGLTRRQLAMVSVLMKRQALRHPFAMTKKYCTLDEVLQSKSVASSTTMLECARKADGAAAIILASDKFIAENGLGNLSIKSKNFPIVIGGGEASGNDDLLLLHSLFPNCAY